MNNMESALYTPFVKEIKALIYRRQYEAMRNVNSELLQLYWEIGEEIYHKQKTQGWGKSVVEILAEELKKEFPGVQGFSSRNLRFMRQFYVEYTSGSILKPMVSELDNNSSYANLQPMVSDLETTVQKRKLPPLVADISWSKNIAIIQKCKDPSEREFYIKATRRFGWTKDVFINNIENR